MSASMYTPWSRLSSHDGDAPPPPPVRTVCVIGAGSSGLVAAKHLRDAGYAVTVFEASSHVAGAFVSKCYDNARLVSSKYLTSFSDLRPSPSDPPHLSLPAYVRYLEQYADQEKLLPLITFGARVTAVQPEEAGAPGYTLRVDPVEADAPHDAYPPSETARPAPQRLEAAATRHFDAVCVCSGLHEVPHVPPILGLESFPGPCLHSADYKEPSLFAGKRVLIIGSGETGMDLAYRAVQTADAVALSTRSGFLAVPHEGFGGGVPLDTLIANLFEHSYEHWWCHKHHFKWRITTLIIRIGFFLSTGSSVGYNQWTGRVADVKRGYNILCKSTAALPYLNRPAKQRAWWRSWLWSWTEPAVDKSISTHPAPAHIAGSTVTFADGSTFDADVIVLATGYRQTFPFLHTPTKSATGAGTASASAAATTPPPAMPAPGVRPPAAGDVAPSVGGAAQWVSCTGARGAEDPLPSEHLIVSPEAPTLSFIGFVRPNVGAIPPMAELQVLWWIQRLRHKVTRGVAKPSYGLLGKKLNYGVDYGNYMHQIAAEIGAAPSVTDLLRSPKALIAYCLGQAYISFFRLVGPFAGATHWKVAETELFDPVVQRGLPMNIIFLGTMAAFAWMNLVAHSVELGLGWIAPAWMARQRAAA